MSDELKEAVEAYNAGYYDIALKKSRPLAESGNAKAQILLGLLYADGESVKYNLVAAHVWFNIAIANGLEGARIGRDALEKHLSPKDLIEAERLANQCINSNYTNCPGLW